MKMNSSSVNYALVNYDYDLLGENGTDGEDEDDYGPSPPMSVGMKAVVCSIYALIFFAGTTGNGLVIYVILRFAKMHSVTNHYICNLAVSDVLYLIGLTLIIVTVIHESWIFGVVMCKVFYILTSINSFTSVFTLTVMSADRYLAVCHPISSIGYRTPAVSRWICAGVWLASVLVMIPIYLYANTKLKDDGRVSCVIRWPINDTIPAERAFILYAFLIGFTIPVSLISIFYTMVVVRLKTSGPGRKSQEKKKAHRKVTKMVLTVIAAYVICWLPFWIFQVTLTFIHVDGGDWVHVVGHIVTVLSNTNSVLNPLLYAFLGETFRKSFIKALCCASLSDANRTLPVEHSAGSGRVALNRSRDMGLTMELESEQRKKNKDTHIETDQIAADNSQAL